MWWLCHYANGLVHYTSLQIELIFFPGNVIYQQDVGESCIADTFSSELMSRVDVRRSMELFTCFSLGFCIDVSLWHTHREPSLLWEMAWCVYICRVSVFPISRFLRSAFVQDDCDVSHTCPWLNCWHWKISSDEKGKLHLTLLYSSFLSIKKKFLAWKTMSRFTVSVKQIRTRKQITFTTLCLPCSDMVLM